jgi:hypothetical protein
MIDTVDAEFVLASAALREELAPGPGIAHGDRRSEASV